MPIDEPTTFSEYPDWLRWAPFIGHAPALTRWQWDILGLVALAGSFGRSDLALLQLALPQIQTSLAIATGNTNNGALPYVLLLFYLVQFLCCDQSQNRKGARPHRSNTLIGRADEVIE